jgi:bifunctional UDP-N-acetylglucosamine pyrophosphorylase/glucosamine-1-phosphate N-acetyltransferase
MSGPTVVILAGGSGTRMRSAKPKLAHDLCGRPLLAWPVAAAAQAGAGQIVVVVPPGDTLAPLLEGFDVEFVLQTEPLGTADAVARAAPLIERDTRVVVLSGDVPLVSAELIAELAGSGADAAMVTTVLDDPVGYGRVVRDAAGAVVRVVETKVAGDASEDELAIAEVNAGIYAFAGGALLDALEEVGSDNAQGERYLPDVIAVMIARGLSVTIVEAGPEAVSGVNDRAELATVAVAAQHQIQHRHMLAGVTIVQPATTSIDVRVAIGEDTVIEPCTQLRGATAIGRGCSVGPHAVLVDVAVADGATIGPFSYLRPGTVLEEGAKAGTFVEIKNSRIGARAKVPHLSYIGDADVGEETNLGAGTITANYDGESKHRTTIGARVHGGVDTSFVAPVSVGDDAWTAAGSVVTGDVPPGALAVARARQRNVERYGERRGEDEPPAS